MGLDPITLAIAFTVVSAAGSIVQRFQEKKAADAEANLIEQEGRLVADEAQAEAQRVANDRRKFRKKQKVAFLKNGISLAGSPLLVIDETIRESQAEVNSIARRGTAQARLAFARAAQTRTAGRVALLGGFFSAAGSLATGAFAKASLGGGTAASAKTVTSGGGGSVGIGGGSPGATSFGGAPLAI